MTVGQLAEVLYPETDVELEYQHKVVYAGEASGLASTKFRDRKVNEVYIGVNGFTVVLAIAGIRDRAALRPKNN